jgi:hypothetical protein
MGLAPDSATSGEGFKPLTAKVAQKGREEGKEGQASIERTLVAKKKGRADDPAATLLSWGLTYCG